MSFIFAIGRKEWTESSVSSSDPIPFLGGMGWMTFRGGFFLIFTGVTSMFKLHF